MRKPQFHRNGRQQLLMPLIGFGLFVLLYVWAALLYPGGSNAERFSRGFSLLDNYWCDLMGDKAKNGDANPARPVAVLAWMVLCVSLGAFWFFLPRLFARSNGNHKVIQYFGITAMVFAAFLFTSYHDLIITLSGFYIAVALIATFIELKKEKQYDLFRLGVACFFMGLLNYAMYTTHFFIPKLPVIQKITYAICLFGFGMADYRIYQKSKCP